MEADVQRAGIDLLKRECAKSKKMKKLFYFLPLLLLVFACNEIEETPLEPRLLTDSVAVEVKGTFDIEVEPASKDWTFEPYDTVIATVSSTGEIIAKRVGVTKIAVRNINKGFLQNCIVNVLPKTTLYREPYMEFDAPLSVVKSYETRTIDFETTDGIYYTGETPQLASVSYTFQDNKLAVVECSIKEEYGNLVENCINERFVFIYGLGSMMRVYVTADYKALVYVTYMSGFDYTIMYQKNTTIPKNMAP